MEVPAASGLSSEFVTMGRPPPSTKEEGESAKIQRCRTEMQPSDEEIRAQELET